MIIRRHKTSFEGHRLQLGQALDSFNVPVREFKGFLEVGGVIDEESARKHSNGLSGSPQEDPRAPLGDQCRTAVYEAQRASRRGVRGFLFVTG